MDEDDIALRIIGLLTAVCTTMHEGGSSRDLLSLAVPVLRGMSLDQESMLEIMATFVTAFAAVCREYEKDFPDADIPKILQDFSQSIVGEN